MPHREQCIGVTDEWYTPAYIFKALNCQFDLDVAYPSTPNPPCHWIPAKNIITNNSLSSTWTGFVWMNPPFGGRNGITPWLEKFLIHNNGIALTPDRTSAPWWQHYAKQMDLVLFVSPKIKFIGEDGNVKGVPAQGTTLMALGQQGRITLENSNLGCSMIPCKS